MFTHISRKGNGFFQVTLYLQLFQVVMSTEIYGSYLLEKKLVAQILFHSQFNKFAFKLLNGKEVVNHQSYHKNTQEYVNLWLGVELVSQISCIFDLIQKFWAKRFGLYTGVCGRCIVILGSLFSFLMTIRHSFLTSGWQSSIHSHSLYIQGDIKLVVVHLKYYHIPRSVA